MKLQLLAIAAVLVLLAGCSATTKSIDVSVTATPAPTQAALNGQFGDTLRLTIVEGQPQGKGVAWSRNAANPADTAITIHWKSSPSTECGRPRELRLDQTSKSVIIQIVPGKQTAATCSLDAHGFTTRVPLSTPIGTRSVLQQ